MKDKNNSRYSAKEAANVLGIYKRTLFNWEDAGKIPRAKRDPMNNYRYYTKEDIAALKRMTKR